MVGIDEDGFEAELMRHYAAQRETPAAERLYELACLMAKEGARVSEAPARRLGDAGFVAAQVRFVPSWSWGAQLVIVTFMVAGTSVATGIGALSVTLWACPPYFCSCAGTLAILRRARTPHAVMSSIAWIAVICSALLAISIAFPGIYGPAALAV
ncbi:hypothetical protein QP551_00110 [Slackia exigua]|uniref:hypothetical protein n=1 Tax=Slackia exigua TaxID=84109 RepID=UPI00254F87C1|nr:hypothetical protein [Slackia exigua]MDK7723111.1 hypothetical protein [Slackia exigua]MDK7725304.1 hypothetical protein [Slackia exigua]